MKTFVSSSGEMQEFVNGDLVHDVGYSANYDGDMADVQVRHGDQEYYTQLDKKTLLGLLSGTHSKSDLMVRLEDAYPVKTSKSSRKRSKKNKKKKKDKSKKNKA